MFGLPTTTSSGVPLMTMEQIQQLQQLQQRNSQSHHHGGSAAGSMQQHGATNSPGTLLPHGSSQQYVLGHEVSPLTSAQFFQNSNSNSVMMNANCASQGGGGGSNNYEALSDAALWKLFWEETSNNHNATPAAAPMSSSMDYAAATTTLNQAAKGGSPTLTSIREHDASAAAPTTHHEQHHHRMGSNVSVSSHVQSLYQVNDETMKPTSRMNSPSPTPSAMSCSTAESKPNVAHHALARVQSQQAPAAALCPPPTLQAINTSWPTTCMSDVANVDEDPLNVMLQQFYQQQQQMQQQQIALQQQQSLAAPQKVQTFSSAAAHDLVPPAPQYQTKAQSRKAAAAEAAKNSSQDIANATYLIPSIVMPPSVMTSVLTPPLAVADVTADDYDAQQRRRRKNTSAANGSKRKNFRQESPQHCLDRILLQMRGYSPGQLRIKADVAQYDITPSPLQLASFGTELVRAIHTSDLGTLSEMLSCGLSPSPCNQFRDSIVDLVCKRANASVFRTLVEHGSDLRVCDGFGRTPLHHCCWASSFSPEIATLILQRDWRQLFLEDKRGQTPLEYVREDLFDEWIAFMQETVEAFVPQHVPNFSPIKLERPEGFLPDPVNAVPPKLAMAVSAGKITPKQVMQMSMETKAKFDD